MLDIINKILGLPTNSEQAIIKEIVLSDCPIRRELKKCPLKDFRKLSLSEKINYRLQNKKELEELYKEHIQCFRKRKKL